MNTVLVHNIRLSVDEPKESAFEIAKRQLTRAGVPCRDVVFSVYRRSVDARKKGRDGISFLYSVAVQGVSRLPSAEKCKELGFERLDDVSVTPVLGDEKLSARPVVVGAGPAGLFAALLLAESGYSPLVLERGGTVAERQASVARFRAERILDAACNIQFGLGGAGTFSDGKLVTRIHDPLTGYCLARFVEFGAPREILYLAKPHIGTDILTRVVTSMAERITSLGGEILYRTTFLRPVTQNGKITAALTDKGTFPAGALVLALGHSARDTFENLTDSGVLLTPKNFSVGVRIEHLTQDIDRALYGDAAGHPALGHAEYALSHNTKERGVYTFCMCPGGEVVAAASEEGGVVTNGMSENARAGKNSNAAVVTSVFCEDFGGTVSGAVAFQRAIEKAAFLAGGSDYSAPVCTVGDFLAGKTGTAPSRILPTYMGGGVRLSSPDAYLPKFVADGIRGGLLDFDRKIRGFAAPDAVLTGAETRTSSPIRIGRDPELRTVLGFDGLYPVGEGAGYAGGITSASVDGVKTALVLMRRFSPVL